MDEKNNEEQEKKLEELKKEVEEHKHEGQHEKEIEVREKEIEKQEEEVKEIEEKQYKKESQNNLIKKSKEGSFRPIIYVMLITLGIAFFWDKVPEIKEAVHFILDPTAGFLIDWNLNLGMLILVFILTLVTTIIQKYGTDQETLKEIKKEQKEIQVEMKKFKNHPEKLMQLQKEQFKLMPKQFKLSMRTLAYTGVPLILFFRWFGDYFNAVGNPKFFLGMGWVLFYLLGAIIIGSILRKWMDVV